MEGGGSVKKVMTTLRVCFSLAGYFSSSNVNAAAVALHFSGIVFVAYEQQRAARVLDRGWAVCGSGCSGGRWVTASVIDPHSPRIQAPAALGGEWRTLATAAIVPLVPVLAVGWMQAEAVSRR